jgi:two-component system sensor histidine kinase VanS
MGWGIKLKNKKKRSLLSKIFVEFLFREIIIIIAISLIFGLIAWIISVLDFNWMYKLSHQTYSEAINLFDFVFTGITPFLIIFLIWIGLSIINIYVTLKKVFSYMDEIINATDKLYDKNVEYIKLPSELSDVEKKLNHFKVESEKNEKLAKENEQKKDELIVYLAHDIKTPLTSMIGYLSLLDEIEDMPQKQRKKYTNIALDKSYRLEELMNELFDVARFNSEHIILEKEEISISLMLEQIIDDFYPILNELNKKIELNVETNIKILADPDKLSRVFNNLIKNAIHYSKEDSDITINVSKSHDQVIIEVINIGKQIPKEKLNRIFEKFYRLDTSRTSKTGGSGLGLAISKEIIELHNGIIYATSDKEKTSFIVKLPIDEN